MNRYHGCGLLPRNKQIIIAQRRTIQRDIIIKYRFPSLSVTVSHGKLKNELRTRDNHELRLSVNPEDDFTDGGDAVPLCVTSSISPLSRLPSRSRAPTSSQFSQSGAQRLRFTVASRSFAHAASVLRSAFSSLLSRTPTRARSEVLRADPIQQRPYVRMFDRSELDEYVYLDWELPQAHDRTYECIPLTKLSQMRFFRRAPNFTSYLNKLLRAQSLTRELPHRACLSFSNWDL